MVKVLVKAHAFGEIIQENIAMVDAVVCFLQCIPSYGSTHPVWQFNAPPRTVQSSSTPGSRIKLTSQLWHRPLTLSPPCFPRELLERQWLEEGRSRTVAGRSRPCEASHNLASSVSCVTLSPPVDAGKMIVCSDVADIIRRVRKLWICTDITSSFCDFKNHAQLHTFNKIIYNQS